MTDYEKDRLARIEEHEKIRKVEREVEMECNCTKFFYFTTKKYKHSYPKKGEDIINYYYDQAASRVQIHDRVIASAWLPYGIQGMDSWYTNQILMGEESKYTPKQLENFIISNPHIHDVIKTNLIENLRRRNNMKMPIKYHLNNILKNSKSWIRKSISSIM